MQDEADAAAINVGGSQGTQLGSGNFMYNAWGQKSPLDPTALKELSPHVAVSRLQSLSHDERVDFFARAKSKDMTEIFVAFLETDEAKIVAVLADVNRRKATELLNTVYVEAILTALPEAALAIARKAASLKWTEPGLLERFEDGYVRTYSMGRVLWHESHGAHAITGEIEEYWADNKSIVKIPKDDQVIASSSLFGTTRLFQRFQDATVYSSEHGSYAVDFTVESCYADEGGYAGWLGFPVTGIESYANDCGWVQDFEGGAIYSRYGGPAYAVRAEVEDAVSGKHDFFPSSKEHAIAQSCYGISGRVQQFEITEESSNDGYGEYENEYEAAVYSTTEHGAVIIKADIWTYYRALGAENSWLGFPVANEVVQAKGWTQRFEGGIIFDENEGEVLSVPAETVELYEQGDMLTGRLGWPVSERRSIEDSGDYIQFFDGGIVTERDGKNEMWIRPKT